jgi:teichuronic acid biosynthesis glycosyltransferase TuaG
MTVTSISVIIPTFNRSTETIRALKSVQNQTYPVKEIIVVDDGSEKSDFDILRENCSVKGVQLVRIKHCGHPGLVRQVGVDHASGEWIAFLDSDDIWLPRKIEIQMGFVRDHFVEAICSKSIPHYPTSKFSNVKSDFRRLKTSSLLRSNEIVTSSVLVKKTLLIDINGFVRSSRVLGVEDLATWLRISKFASWHILDLPLVVYSLESQNRMSMQQTETFLWMHALVDFSSWLRKVKAKKLFFYRVITRILIRSL